MKQTNREYAEALFLLGSEKNLVKEYGEALCLIKKVVADNPSYIDFLSSPAIPMSDRIKAIDEAFSADLPEDVLILLKLFCEKGHIAGLFDLVLEYEKLSDALFGTVDAEIVSAVELSDSQKEALLAKLCKKTGKKVFPIYKVDSALIGGIKITIDGTTYDGTIKTRLRDIKEVMM